jgi:hypothetical protein
MLAGTIKNSDPPHFFLIGKSEIGVHGGVSLSVRFRESLKFGGWNC